MTKTTKAEQKTLDMVQMVLKMTENSLLLRKKFYEVLTGQGKTILEASNYVDKADVTLGYAKLQLEFCKLSLKRLGERQIERRAKYVDKQLRKNWKHAQMNKSKSR